VVAASLTSSRWPAWCPGGALRSSVWQRMGATVKGGPAREQHSRCGAVAGQAGADAVAAMHALIDANFGWRAPWRQSRDTARV
jgi:hypothetical protein